jgi:ectoine hydroxylase-related dioxygenase (phytanoyl-CoA dioxygenase family)
MKKVLTNKNNINDFNFLKIRKLYQKKGFVIIKNFLPKNKINRIRFQITNSKKRNKFFYFEKIKNKKKLRRIERISEFSKNSKKLICSKEIFRLIKNIENSEYKLFKDKLNFKYPGGAGYLPHIDGHFLWRDKNNKLQDGWKKYSNNFINLVLPLEKTNKKNGCIYLAKKKDTKKIGKTFRKISTSMSPGTPNIKNKDIKKFKFFPIELEIGDICLFNWKCAHYSRKNFSSNSRMIFYATYYKKNSKSSKNIRTLYYQDKLKSKNSINNKSLLFN